MERATTKCNYRPLSAAAMPGLHSNAAAKYEQNHLSLRYTAVRSDFKTFLFSEKELERTEICSILKLFFDHNVGLRFLKKTLEQCNEIVGIVNYLTSEAETYLE